MTTKPRARKFRIKRGAPSAGGAGAAAAAEEHAAEEMPEETAAEPTPEIRTARTPRTPRRERSAAPEASPPPTAPDMPAAEAPAAEVASPAQVRGETSIDEIRKEGLTGRQLRMARRVAQKHGIAPTSDFDAVRQLRERGIDPFQRGNMLELVVPSDGQGGDSAEAAPRRRAQLPQTVPAGKTNLPAEPMAENPAERRALEVRKIQVDMARRRQRRLLLLLARVCFFIFLPTLLAGYYFYVAATPMYSTKSEFLILQADATGGSGGIGGLLSGTQFATNGDSIATQSYLQSKDAMLRLDADVGFKSHFTQEWIDPIQRMDPDPSNETAYKEFKRRVKIGYDPTEGVIRMEVVAATPDQSLAFSEALIGYAEERVNDLSQQKRADSMRDARQAFEKAEQERKDAQEQLIKLQVESQAIDPEGIIGSLRGQISNVETLILEKELALAAQLDNARPNQAKVDGLRADIFRLNQQLEKINDRMINAREGGNSLAEKTVRIQIAEADLMSRDLMMQSALTQMEQTRAEANRQVRYLTVAVRPVQPESASYPRAFENTLLAFIIFAGIYLMISLTAAILREQIGS